MPMHVTVTYINFGLGVSCMKATFYPFQCVIWNCHCAETFRYPPLVVKYSYGTGAAESDF